MPTGRASSNNKKPEPASYSPIHRAGRHLSTGPGSSTSPSECRACGRQAYVSIGISRPVATASVSTGSRSSRIPFLYSALIPSSSTFFGNRNR